MQNAQKHRFVFHGCNFSQLRRPQLSTEMFEIRKIH
jgi:hypothetical protein